MVSEKAFTRFRTEMKEDIAYRENFQGIGQRTEHGRYQKSFESEKQIETSRRTRKEPSMFLLLAVRSKWLLPF